MRIPDAIFLVLMALPLVEAAALAVLAVAGWRYRSPSAGGGGGGGTVLVATRDEDAGLVRECVEAAIASRAVARVVVVDDSGEEGYGELRRALAGLEGVVLLHREVNRGFKPGALNDGLRLAAGGHVIVADADTRLDGFPEVAAALLASGYDAVQASTRPARLTGLVGEAYAVATLFRDAVLAPGCAALGLPFLSGYGYAVKRGVLEEVGGWSEDTVAEDLDLSLRLAARGVKYAFLSDVAVLDEPPAAMSSFRAQQRRWMRGSVQVTLRGLRMARRPRALAFTLVAGAFTGLLVNVAAAASALLAPLLGAPSRLTILLATLALDAPLALVAARVLVEARARLGLWRAVRGMAVTMLLYNALSPYLLLDLAAALAGRRGRWERTAKAGAEPARGGARAYLGPLALYAAATAAAAASAPALLPWVAGLAASAAASLALEALT